MKTMNHHDIRSPEETMHHLSPVVPAGPKSGRSATACSNPECQTARRQKTHSNWRKRNSGYSIEWRIDQQIGHEVENAVSDYSPEASAKYLSMLRIPSKCAKNQNSLTNSPR
jgi:hypothetical protein